MHSSPLFPHSSHPYHPSPHPPYCLPRLHKNDLWWYICLLTKHKKISTQTAYFKRKHFPSYQHTLRYPSFINTTVSVTITKRPKQYKALNQLAIWKSRKQIQMDAYLFHTFIGISWNIEMFDKILFCSHHERADVLELYIYGDLASYCLTPQSGEKLFWVHQQLTELFNGKK